jgi:nucleoside-diphosphate-sugar epimerase
MRILVTGASGFVGRHVVSALLDQGVEVCAVTRTRKPPNISISTLKTDDVFSHSVEFWREKLCGFDAVIHCAWYTDHGKYLHSNKNLDCMLGTIQLVRGAEQAGVKHFQGIGTCYEYDLSQLGDCSKQISVDSPLRPTTLYGGTKAATFLALAEHCKEMKFSWSRLFYLFGNGEDERRLVPHVHSLLSQNKSVVINSGDRALDYLYVVEAGRQIVEVTKNQRSGPLNICSGRPTKLSDLVLSIADFYGCRELVQFTKRSTPSNEPRFVIGKPSMKVNLEASLNFNINGRSGDE